MARHRKPAPNITSIRRRRRHVTKLALFTDASSIMTNHRKPAPRLQAMPAEILDLIARHTFRGQVIKLGDPLELRTVELLAVMNPIASILCIKGVVGRRAMEVMLQEVIFTLPNLHILSTRQPRLLKQLNRIRNLGITCFDLGTPTAESYLSRLRGLKRLAVTMDWWDTRNAPPGEIARGWMLSVCRGLRLGCGDIMGARRVLWGQGRAYEVELGIAVYRGEIDRFKDLNVVNDEEQAAFRGCECPWVCGVVVSGGGIVQVDVTEREDGEGWRGAVGREFRLEEG